MTDKEIKDNREAEGCLAAVLYVFLFLFALAFLPEGPIGWFWFVVVCLPILFILSKIK